MIQKVFISSPYTIGDIAQNVKLQIDNADELLTLGYIPYVPLLTHFWHIIHPHNYTTWIVLDIEWLRGCDCILRIGGESKGADLEVKKAEELNIPVFYSISELEENKY